MPGDYHLVHLGARAMGGAGLVFAEMTCPSPDARITPGCPGLWNDAQTRRPGSASSTSCTANTDAKIAHAARPRRRQGLDARAVGGRGPAAATRGNWPLISASPQQYLDGVSAWSRAMTRADMDRVRDDFVARDAAAPPQAGFDWLELHCAHGYLLSGFISPLTNQRTDEYGGSLENRLRYPLEVFAAMRAVWPQRQADVGAHLRARLGRTAASRRTTRWRSRAPSRPPAPT